MLKMLGLARGELVADWVGSCLAHRLEIRCPPIDIADVSIDALRTAPAEIQKWARPGPAFASREIVTAKSGLRDAEIVEGAGAEMLGAMYALDTWLEVLDRRVAGVWNALLDTDSQEIYAIDFGKGLTPCLHKLIGHPIDTTRVQEANYGSAAKAAASKSSSLDTCARIEGLNRTELEEICISVPSAWIDEPTRAQVVEFLVGRQPGVRAVCSRLSGQ
ncbi:MAG: hypothetical protein EPO22_03875 [Dehalococcoidia bacterium]|nr:MAG: hypothetical protein EPO22_03875 [Dehalococcoidia bacterium]